MWNCLPKPDLSASGPETRVTHACTHTKKTLTKSFTMPPLGQAAQNNSWIINRNIMYPSTRCTKCSQKLETDSNNNNKITRTRSGPFFYGCAIFFYCPHYLFSLRLNEPDAAMAGTARRDIICTEIPWSFSNSHDTNTLLLLLLMVWKEGHRRKLGKRIAAPSRRMLVGRLLPPLTLLLLLINVQRMVETASTDCEKYYVVPRCCT